MKIVMIAALVAAHLAAATPSAQAADLPSDQLAQQSDISAGARLREEVELNLGDVQAAKPRTGLALTAAAQEEQEPRKKRKSTGDKVLTGAAVVLGIGALAVGGLLVAIFVS